MRLEKLNECIQKRRVNHSRAREAIYNILLNSDECLNVSQIAKELSNTYPKKLSQNTLYRHLNFFIECKLVVVIQDNLKRAYYYLSDNTLMTFCICTKCSNVNKLDLVDFIDIDAVDDVEFITLHNLCKNCKD